MAKLKGVKRLNSVIEQFFVELGYPEIECDLGFDFAYYYGCDEIDYTIFSMSEADEGFRRYLKTTYPKMPKCSLFVFSLLHELGHHLTMPSFSDEDFKNYKIKKDAIENEIANTPKEKIARQIKYCSLPDEAIATQKAVEILLENYNYITDFEKTCFKEIKRFYLVNNIKNA